MGDEIVGGEELTFGRRLQHAWNAFKNKDPSLAPPAGIDYNGGVVSTTRPDRRRFNTLGLDRTIAGAIYNRIATDAASVVIQHVRLNETGGIIEELDSGLNEVLTVSANTDQTGRAMIQDLVMSMLDEGVVAVVPVDTSINPRVSGSYDIHSVRVGKITQWWPDKVQVDLYNEHKGIRELVMVQKKYTAIIENPFYAVMNEPNSTLRRLTHKLALMDDKDDELAAGKLDLIIQLPYATKSEARQQQAESRLNKIQEQLTGSPYGIAYIDGTERVTQLNRSVENKLLAEIEYLTSMLYSQLGLTQEILNGTATEDSMTNYYRRTIDVILTAITDEFTRKFLTKTGRTQGQAVKFYRDPFSLTPTNAIADIADKFTRNEILSPNEVRGIVGFKPSADPSADELRNRNISQSVYEEMGSEESAPEEYEDQQMPGYYQDEEEEYDEV